MTEDQQAVYSMDRGEIIRHAMHKAMMVSSGLAGTDRSAELVRVMKDPKLAERAVELVLKQMLRELVQKESRPAQFTRLLDEIASLANES